MRQRADNGDSQNPTHRKGRMRVFDFKRGQRVQHKFGQAGVVATGNVRHRDQRVLVNTDDGERLWCAVEFLDAVV